MIYPDTPASSKCRFRKGHVITEEDIPVLLSLGKDNIYVWEQMEGMTHENDAAVFLKDITMGDGLEFGEIKEGKINFKARYDGLLKVDEKRLYELNLLGEICFATLQNNMPVKKGQAVAGERVIPLLIDQKKLDTAREVLDGNKIIEVRPFSSFTVGMVRPAMKSFIRIEDKFGPVSGKKWKIKDDKPAIIVKMTGKQSLKPYIHA